MGYAPQPTEPGPSGLVARRSLTALEDPSSIPDAG